MTENTSNQESQMQQTDAVQKSETPRGAGDSRPIREDGVPPSGQDGDGGENGGWMRLIIDANPLYLLSVLLMIAGLYLVNGAASENAVGVGTVTGFFGVQNVYEIVLVAMAIYLLRTGTNSRHGKLLLLFVMVFLADLTFYQVRIAVMDRSWGFTLSTFYLILGAAKVWAVLAWLEIKVRWERLVYPLMAFGMIYYAPNYIYSVMDSTGNGNSGMPFSGQVDVYMIWLVAAAIQLPVIVANWRKSSLEEAEPNPYVGDATTFSWVLLLFPFAILPFQLEKNVMADAAAGNPAIGKLTFVYLPYLLAGVFFFQSFFRTQIAKIYSINAYDAAVLIGLTLFALFTARTDEIGGGLSTINWYLVFGAHLVVALTRRNLFCAGFLGLVAVRYFGLGIKTAAGNIYDYGRTLSTTTWAALLMAGSFISLGLGFLLSIGTKNLRKS